LKINASKKAIEKIEAAGGTFDFPKKGMESETPKEEVEAVEEKVEAIEKTKEESK